MKNNNYYVYIYLDPRKRGHFTHGSVSFLYEPFYVGKGQSNRASTLLAHNAFCKNKVKKILNSNFIPLIVYYREDISEIEAFDLEKELITVIGRIDLNAGPLTNLTDGGQGKENPSKAARQSLAQKMQGKRHSQETKDRISKNNGAKREDIKLLLSEMHKGNKHPRFGQTLSEEYKKKISKTLEGRVLSAETKRKMSENNHNKGKSLSEETRKKLSDSPMFGRSHSEESKKKISENNGCRKEEVRLRLSEARRGKKHSSETRRKMSEAAKRRHVPKEVA